MKNNIKILVSSLFITGTVFAQNGQMLIKKAIIEQQTNLVEEFRSFLSIPNVAVNPKGLQDNANWIKNYMQSKGIEDVSLLSLPNTQMPPVVYGEVKIPGATETIIFYAHYDGQPVDTSKWFPGLHPFKPTLYSGSYENGATALPWLSAGNNYDVNS